MRLTPTQLPLTYHQLADCLDNALITVLPDAAARATEQKALLEYYLKTPTNQPRPADGQLQPEDEAAVAVLQKAVALRVEKKIPLAYILNRLEFFGLPFHVTNATTDMVDCRYRDGG